MHTRKPAAVLAASFLGSFTLLGSAFLSLAAPAPDARDPDAPVCKARYMMPYWDSFRVFGIYELSNGDRLRVRRETKHYFAEMGRTGRIEILPLSADRFAEKGGPLRFEFDQQALGDQDVTITGLEQPRPRGRVCAD